MAASPIAPPVAPQIAGPALVTAEQMRALDAHTIERIGVAGDVLMESAGRALVELTLQFLGGSGGRVGVVCGPGNNGGDGWVAARHLHQLGVGVEVLEIGGERGRSADAERNRARALAVGVVEAGELASDAAVVIDALFGTGLARDVAGEFAEAIGAVARARAAGAQVLAADVPSGLCADTGRELGACVAADCTVAFGLAKPGLLLEPGRSRAGRVRVARIGIADEAPGVYASVFAVTPGSAARAVPARPSGGHKGTFGHVLVVAGSEGKTGAAALAARAAIRSGAGLVTVACPRSLNDVLEPLCLEAMTVPVAETPARSLAPDAEDGLLDLAHDRSVVALGPGVGTDEATRALVRSFLARCERPVVLDADGLNALDGKPDALAARPAPTILTPHPGEAARLLGSDAAAINADRLAAARTLAERSGAHVVLKGAPTVTALAPGVGERGPVLINTSGGPALGTGGTGDVLTGVLAAFVAQGVALEDAGALAAFVHGFAGDRLAERDGDAGLLASELADAIPATLAELVDRRELREAARDGASARSQRGLLVDVVAD